MDSCRWNLMFLLSVNVLISSISASDASVRNKRAPTISNQGLHPNSVDLPQVAFPIKSLASDAPVAPDVRTGNVDSDGAKPKKKEHVKIAETPECADEVRTFCSEKVHNNNILVLDCLQDNEKAAIKLSDSCHHFLWTYKLKLTKDTRFEDASNEACAPELEKIPECKTVDRGEVIPCFIEHYEDIKSKPCSLFLNKIASIIFSDYRFMNFFIKDCKQDILALSCGRVEPFENEDDSPHSQGRTITCLNEQRKKLSKACKKSILRVAELQSDDFHLDRPLYYACKGDREHLCHDVVAGDGAVFKCLYKHLGDPKLSDNCRARLEERQQLIAEDVKIDKSFYEACKDDIKENDCTLRGHRDDVDLEENLSRSSILLCLEEAQSKNRDIKPECVQEMFELRSELMQDYKISPELVSACKDEIEHLCPLRPDGNVLQCLMKSISHRRQKLDKDDDISSECVAEVTKLIQVVNPGEDIRLDGPLMRSCGDVVTQVCSEYEAGHGEVITCLLENMDHEDMTDECEDELLVIQYFAARDFRLDFHLFKQCRNDALTLCHSTGFSDPSTMKPDEGPLVFSCLHSYLRSTNPQDTQPSRQCIHEIKRVMRERSFRVNLMPEIEDACLIDLSSHCSNEDEHRKYNWEIECLQSNLHILTEPCKLAVNNFTLEAVEDIEVDRTLMKACHPMMKKFCSDLLASDTIPAEVLDCLIDHKNHNDMNVKCAASIEHHQIVALEDFRLNAKFREVCQESVSTYCKMRKTKYEIVACLSEHIRNDTLKDAPQRIEHRCKQQLKFELLQRAETIELDAELKKSCDSEIQQFCQYKTKEEEGEGEILECLRAHKGKLGSSCYLVLFQRERDAAIFGDYSLLRVCKETIKKYCNMDAEEADILKCLIDNKDQFDNFDDRCRQLVQHRQIERAQDIELNPLLQKACRLDIPKFCANVFNDRSNKDGRMEGRVIDCLKKTYATKGKVLTEECKREIQFRIKESAVDVNLNPILLKTCKMEIKKFCLDNIAHLKSEDVDGGEEGYHVFGSGTIMECLKKHFNELRDTKCKEEVAYAVAESRLDLNVDPLLHTACQHDLMTHCREIPQGQGRQMSCLLSHLGTNPKGLTRDCKVMLQHRKELWESAAKVAPAETFSEIFDQMSSSPARNYFFAIMFTVVGIIFLVGLTFGRVTKRVRAEIKNK